MTTIQKETSNRILRRITDSGSPRVPAFRKSVIRTNEAAIARKPVARRGKRIFDVIAASVALLVLLPLLLVIAFLVKLDGGPAFFAHKRPGYLGDRFPILKFRSMRVDAEARLEATLAQDQALAEEWKRFQKLKNDPRTTRFGRFIRKTSLDELPQLWNVLRGEMSVVGPRPMLMHQLDAYGPEIVYYSSMRPGITGLWQISGRSSTTFDEKTVIETRYVKSWTFWGDIVIILKTIPALLNSKNAY